MKARFITEQLPVNVVETEKAKYIFICINGEKKMEKFENYTDESPISSVTEQEYWIQKVSRYLMQQEMYSTKTDIMHQH